MTIISGSCGENATYRLEDDYTLYIEGTGAMNDFSSWTSTPWYSNSNYSKILKVVISEGITRIGIWSFYMFSKLEEIILPDTIESVGNYAIWKNNPSNPLFKVNRIPSSLRSIEPFGMCCFEIDEIILPEGITTISNNAFENCKTNYIEIPASVTSIGGAAFASYPSTTYTIKFNGSQPTFDAYSVGFTTASRYPKNNCTVLTNGWSGTVDNKFDYATLKTYTSEFGDNIDYTFENGKLTLTGSGDMYDFTITTCPPVALSRVKSIRIEDGITKVGAYAFTYGSIKGIELADSITTIGNYAFNGCTINRLILPAGLTTLGTNVFTFNTDNVEHIVICWRNRRLSSLVTNANAMIHEFSMNDPEQSTETYTAGTPNCTRPIMMRVFGGWKVIDSSKMVDNT